MAGRTLMALDVRELLRRLRAGQSDRTIRNATGTACKTIRRYREIAQQQGWLGDGPLPELADLDAALKELAPAIPLPPQPFTAAPFQDVITRLRRQGVEMKAIHQRLCEDHGYTGSYSALWRFVRHLEPCEPAAFVRLEPPAGQQAQVDFTAAGTMIDPQSGRSRKVWCFVMTLSCSRHQFAILVFDQKVETWLRCHRLAFEHFGGVPRQIVIDNLSGGEHGDRAHELRMRVPRSAPGMPPSLVRRETPAETCQTDGELPARSGADAEAEVLCLSYSPEVLCLSYSPELRCPLSAELICHFSDEVPLPAQRKSLGAVKDLFRRR